MKSCPKCGFEQESGAECLRCGIIFDRYVPPPEPAAGPVEARSRADASEESPVELPQPSAARRIFRVARWVALGFCVLVIFLILKPAAPPDIDNDPNAFESVEAKLQAAEAAVQRGRPHTLAINEGELNGWLLRSISRAAAAESSAVRRRAADQATGGAISRIPGVAAPSPPASPSPDPTLAEVQDAVTDLRIELVEDRVRGYVGFNLYGKRMSLILEGRLRVENGYLRFEPTAGQLGSLPLLGPTLSRAAGRVFDSPENREKFRVPDSIRDIRVENGELKVSYR